MIALPAVARAQPSPPASIRLTLDIDPDMAVFAGHFPDQPLLPGVTQIDWAVRLARRYLHCNRRFAGMDAVKFTRVIVPPARVDLTLDWCAETATLAFCYWAPDTETSYSGGKLRFQP